ncbi:hypothetical protein NDR87_20845 [Nocardia sp. CDC159]|uniref:Secreted protein n=1 Tax=Nocardia pulmonis TaxID=2951408 RepID=A0A9X2IZS9_9NOCA|nr:MULTISPECIES: hypothetical protein [Nocardia]MCM6776395.1 hypothetical protein [Nocardia pulmonis]MCM6788819.1 hypothetical protein [Nocardia sp. CDC159]
MRKFITRSALAAVAGSLFAAVAAGSGPAAAGPGPDAFAPLITVGAYERGGAITCAGYLDVIGDVFPGQQPGPAMILLQSHFAGISPRCLVSGTVAWTNLDTGATGSKSWDLSGWDGPAAPTAVYFDPGRGRISFTVDSVTWCVPSRGEMKV